MRTNPVIGLVRSAVKEGLRLLHRSVSFDSVWEDLKRLTGPDWAMFPTLAERRPNHFRYNPEEDLIELRTGAWQSGKPHRKLERSLLASAWETLVSRGRCTRLDFPRQKHSSAVITLLAQLDYVQQTGPHSVEFTAFQPTEEHLDAVVEVLLEETAPPAGVSEDPPSVYLEDAVIARLNQRNQTDARVRQSIVNQFERDSRLSRLIKRKRGYVCQICGPQNTFPTLGGHPYVETHHLDWLSDEGRDIEENILVVCAVCHRKFHYGVPAATVVRDGEDLTVTLCGKAVRIATFTARR